MTMQIKVAGYTSLKLTTGRPLFVRNDTLDTYQRVRKESRINYHMTSIMRTLMMLNTDAIRGCSLNPAGDNSISTPQYRIQQTIPCGKISSYPC